MVKKNYSQTTLNKQFHSFMDNYLDALGTRYPEYEVHHILAALVSCLPTSGALGKALDHHCHRK